LTFFLIGFQPIRKKPISKTTNLFFHRYLGASFFLKISNVQEKTNASK